MKTNKHWYPYETLGGYFKLENGNLMGCPMNKDGTREDIPSEVDWYEAWDYDLDPRAIIQELQTKE
jgi:hypothetical protein